MALSRAALWLPFLYQANACFSHPLQGDSQMKLKQLSAVFVAASLILTPLSSQAGGIPVFDAASIAKSVEQLASLKEQIDNQVQQIQQLKAQLQALTGSRNLGNVARNVAMDSIPDEWKDIYNQAKSIDWQTPLSGQNYSPETALQQLVNQQNFSLSAFNDTKNRLNRLQVLLNEVNKTKDAKAAADLQNRIAVEQAMIQNTQVKLDMMARMYQIQKEVDEVQGRKQLQCLFLNRGDRSKCQ